MPRTENDVEKALRQLAEVSESLASHGAGGCTVETSALDVVFLRTLVEVRDALGSDPTGKYDPYGEIYAKLPPEV